jgi:hypothetical protein
LFVFCFFKRERDPAGVDGRPARTLSHTEREGGQAYV